MPWVVINDHVKATFTQDMDGASTALESQEIIEAKARPFINIWTHQNTDNTTETM